MILDQLRIWATQKTDKTCIQTRNDKITYFELYYRILDMATLLEPHTNQPVLLLFHSHDVISFIVAFYACLMAGAIAVPVGTNYARIQNDCNASAIITSWGIYFKIRWRTHWSTSFVVEGGWGCVRSKTQKELTDEERIVMLQYTSGSTCSPRGVMISHRALCANVQWTSSELAKSNTKMVAWVPFTHDYGLTCILNTLHVGGKMVYMSPIEFLQDPLQWLHVVTREKATHTAAPNFAYELCVRRATVFPHKVKGIDLRSVCCNFSMGGETVQKTTLDLFTSTFSVSEAQMDPSYGLAECVCGIIHFQDSTNSKKLMVANGTVTVGKVGDNIEITILPDQRYSIGGEILVRGQAMMSGYYKKDPNEGFHVMDGVKWVKTGDIGFVDEEGYLYIIGRSKDTIVLNGRNVVATDVEHVIATAFPNVRPGSIAAVPIQTGSTEQLGVVAELRDDSLIPDIQQVRAVVYDALKVPIYRMVFVPKKTLPKTTSGKIQRYKCRSYL